MQTYNIYFIYFRSERLSLQDQSESASIKVNQLLAEILEVKQQLEEVEDRYSAGMGITHRIRTEFTVYRHGVKCALSLCQQVKLCSLGQPTSWREITRSSDLQTLLF